MWRSIIFLVLLLLGLAGFMRLRSARDAAHKTSSPEQTSGTSAGAPAVQAHEASPGSGRALLPTPPAETTGARIARIFNSDTIDPAHRLAPVEIMEYFARHKTNAFSLVTAFTASGDPEYLKLAAERFPDDPLVQTRVLLHDLFPAERAQWLDRLKQSSPDNSLPHFLSARDLLQAGDVNGALQEINQARDKTFNDFTKEMTVAGEEAYLSAGRNPAEAKALGSMEVLLPHLAQLKMLGIGLMEQATEYGSAGDHQSQQTLLAASWELGNQLRQDGRKGMLLNELVGLAVENETLRAWPEGVDAPFLDKSPAEQLAENQKFRAEAREFEGMLSDWLPTATENEILAYFERLRVFGELDAMQWLRNQKTTPTQ